MAEVRKLFLNLGIWGFGLLSAYSFVDFFKMGMGVDIKGNTEFFLKVLVWLATLIFYAIQIPHKLKRQKQVRKEKQLELDIKEQELANLKMEEDLVAEKTLRKIRYYQPEEENITKKADHGE